MSLGGSRPTCMACDKNEHDKCVGTVVYMEQDGPNRYVCTCPCNRRTVETKCATCRGKGVVTHESFDKNVSRAVSR